MTKPSPKINFDHLSQQKPPTKKKRRKEKKKKEKQGTDSTREIRFKRQTFANLLTFFFWSLFVGMAIVLLIFNSRLGEITKVATAKAVDTEKISTAIQRENQYMDTIQYEGKTFLNVLFTYDSSEVARKEREEQLQTYLANNLNANNLLIESTNDDRTVKEIEFIEATSLGKERYTLFYNVSYQDGTKPVKLGVKLTVSYQDKKFQLVNVPSITMFQENRKEPTETYNQSEYYSQGSEVSEEAKKKIDTFLQSFFDMYLANDERLSLVSAVQGIGEGTMNNFTIENIVQLDKETYAIQGTYTFSMQENSQITSFFDCTIKSNKDSYFVETFN